MVSNEARRSPAEQALMTELTGDIAYGVIARVGSGRGVVVDRAFPSYKVSYHPNGNLGISSPNVNAFFYPRDVEGQANQQEMVREIRTADGRDVLSERTLAIEEAQGLSSVVTHPSQRELLTDATGIVIGEALIIDRLVELSDRECLEASTRVAELTLDVAETEREAQATANLRNDGNILHAVFVARPASGE
jgi:hypothetical protein